MISIITGLHKFRYPFIIPVQKDQKNLKNSSLTHDKFNITCKTVLKIYLFNLHSFKFNVNKFSIKTDRTKRNVVHIVLQDGSGFARIRVFTPSYSSVSMSLHFYPLKLQADPHVIIHYEQCTHHIPHAVPGIRTQVLTSVLDIQVVSSTNTLWTDDEIFLKNELMKFE